VSISVLILLCCSPAWRRRASSVILTVAGVTFYYRRRQWTAVPCRRRGADFSVMGPSRCGVAVRVSSLHLVGRADDFVAFGRGRRAFNGATNVTYAARTWRTLPYAYSCAAAVRMVTRRPCRAAGGANHPAFLRPSYSLVALRSCDDDCKTGRRLYAATAKWRTMSNWHCPASAILPSISPPYCSASITIFSLLSAVVYYRDRGLVCSAVHCDRLPYGRRAFTLSEDFVVWCV